MVKHSLVIGMDRVISSVPFRRWVDVLEVDRCKFRAGPDSFWAQQNFPN